MLSVLQPWHVSISHFLSAIKVICITYTCTGIEGRQIFECGVYKCGCCKGIKGCVLLTMSLGYLLIECVCVYVVHYHQWSVDVFHCVSM